MNLSIGSQTGASRLDRLLTFLSHDPDNLALIADAAGAALDEQKLDIAAGLIDRYETHAPLPPPLTNLRGIVAMCRQDYGQAGDIFRALLDLSPSDPALKFNLAWCQAMQQGFAGAAELLDGEVIAANPRAASLKIECLHHLGLYDDGLEIGAALAARRPSDTALMGALATLALDAERMDLAELYASQAGDNPDGLAAQGMLGLNDSRVDDSLALFERTLRARPDSPRGMLGMGLGLLAKGEPLKAAGYLERGAAIFGDHLGSWVATGWAFFVAGDYKSSRASFDHALSLDDTFAETHGGLAVLDIVDGDLESARRRTDIALRLDRLCFSGALARSLLLAAAGDQSGAERVRNLAMNVPIGPDGRTIAQSIVAMGAASRRGPKPN